MNSPIRFLANCANAVLLLVISFNTLCIVNSYAQSSSINQKIEELYGSNSLLVNGTQFFDPHPNANHHPYYGSEKWQQAALFISGEKYHVPQLKYNIVSDALILNFINSNSGIKPILLYSTWIDSFYLGGKKFIEGPKIEQGNFNRTYLEVIYEGKQKILVQHEKYFKKQYNDYNPFGLYSNDRKSLFLVYRDEIFQIRNKRKFLNVFPNQKREIKKFLRRKKIKYKEASNADWLILMNYLNTISQ